VVFPDFVHAGNQGGNPGLYEIENAALDPERYVLDAMRGLAPWDGRTIVDLGGGSGFWLPGYADEAAHVIGVEPDPSLLPLAVERDRRVRVVSGSAEHIPLPDASVDVVHARFAYFFPPGCDAGPAEVMRVLSSGQFADLLAASPWAVAKTLRRSCGWSSRSMSPMPCSRPTRARPDFPTAMCCSRHVRPNRVARGRTRH